MRKLLALLLSVLLLTGCAAPAGEPRSTSASVETPVSPLVCEWPEYDLSAEGVTCIFTNPLDTPFSTGSAYSLQRRTALGTWKDIPIRENGGFTAIEYIIAPGDSMAFGVPFSFYDYEFTPGEYRVVKDDYTAEFSLVNEVPQEKNLVICDGTIIENADLAAEFLKKAALDMDCRLSILDAGTGETTEIRHEDSRYLLRTPKGDDILETYFSYIITDGTDIYLSNAADWETAMERAKRSAINTSAFLLLPQGCADAEMVSTVEEMTADRIAGNITRYKVWSPDGTMDASLSVNPTEIGMGTRGSGIICDLQDYDGLETAILDLTWQDDGSVLLTCDTTTGEQTTLRAVFEKEPLRITITKP